MWPAMWSNTFSEDGKGTNKLANAELADKYGIVMGTSHHEPLCRAGVEWQNKYRQYGTSNAWDFNTNETAITKFWEDGVARNKNFENKLIPLACVVSLILVRNKRRKYCTLKK